MPSILSSVAQLALVLVLTLFGGYFVAMEYALVTVRRTRLDQLVSEGNRRARAVRATVNELGTLLAATQLGVTMVSLGLGILTEPTVARLLDPLVSHLATPLSQATLHTIAVAIGFLFITALDIVVGELAPKTIGLQFNERVAMNAIRPLRLFIFVFRPFLELLEAAGSAVARLAGAHPASAGQSVYSPAELEMLVHASTTAGVLNAGAEEMLVRVLDFSRLSAGQIMVPRTEVAAIPATISLRELLAFSARERHTKFPVYEESLDNIVGIVYLRDILHQRERLEGSDFDVRRLMREPLTEPETIEVDRLLRSMQRRRIHIAILIDEFGGTAGLVTLEDLLERIVGEVHDEFEPAATEMQLLPDGGAEIDGLTMIEDVNDRFGLRIQDENNYTIGGYVFGRLGRLAAIGDRVEAGNRTLSVAALDGRRIARLHLSPPPVAPVEAESAREA